VIVFVLRNRDVIRTAYIITETLIVEVNQENVSSLSSRVVGDTKIVCVGSKRIMQPGRLPDKKVELIKNDYASCFIYYVYKV
jgi:hypothetical protein